MTESETLARQETERNCISWVGNLNCPDRNRHADDGFEEVDLNEDRRFPVY